MSVARLQNLNGNEKQEGKVVVVNFEWLYRPHTVMALCFLMMLLAFNLTPDQSETEACVFVVMVDSEAGVPTVRTVLDT
jgi:hypothetical protein